MRILMIAATYPPTRCGVGDYVRRLGQELALAGAEVFVLTGESEDEEHEHGAVDPARSVEARPAARAVEAPRFEGTPEGIQLARAVHEWDWPCLDTIEATLDAVAPDVVALQYHGEDYLLHPAVCCVPEITARRAIASVVTLHNLQEPRPAVDDAHPLSHLLTTASGWICTNLIDERRLQHLPAAAERLTRIATGASITAPEGVHGARDGGPFRFVYFGFLNPVKGVEYLLRAAGLLARQGREFRLVMAAGVHTDAVPRLRAYVESIDAEIAHLDLGEHFESRGYVPDEEISSLLRDSDLAVFPFREGASGKNTSFWSAMQHATPCLTTRGEGHPAGLLHRQNVLFSPIDDAEALAEQMAWAMDHRDECEAIGRAGREHVESRLGWASLAERTLAVFESARDRLRGITA